MHVFVVRRLLHTLLVLVGVSAIVFFSIQITGDPVALLLQEVGNPTAEQIESLREWLGLDKPPHIQFIQFLGRLTQGEFGPSIRYRGREALELVRDRLPATALLAVTSFLVSLVIAVPAGIIAAVKRNSVFDFLTRLVSLAGISFPNFWIAIVLIFTFAMRLRWLPASGQGTWAHLVLPSIALGTSLAASTMRLLRSSVLEVFRLDYITTARAKGLPERVVLYRHALRNAFIPVITVMALQLGSLLGGAVIIETVFSWRGLGLLAVEAINFRDYNLVQATVLTIAAFMVLMNLVVDVLYAVIDPRIRYT